MRNTVTRSLAVAVLTAAALIPTLSAPIAVIHRADGSGTTFNFTDYLSKVSAEWKVKAGAALLVHWPTGTGVKGNEGMAQAVRAMRNSIGYVEYAQASQLGLAHALIQNRRAVGQPRAEQLSGCSQRR